MDEQPFFSREIIAGPIHASLPRELYRLASTLHRKPRHAYGPPAIRRGGLDCGDGEGNPGGGGGGTARAAPQGHEEGAAPARRHLSPGNAGPAHRGDRSDARRDGNEGVRTGRFRWEPET